MPTAASWSLAAVAIGAASGGAALALWLAARLRRSRGRRAQRTGQAGERDARRLLERADYHVLEAQPRAEGWLSVNGEPRRYAVTADFLAGRGRKRFVVEVKTGHAARVANRRTRRQLLEYALVYAVDGALLVDVDQARVHEICWQPPAWRRTGSGRALAIALAVAGVLAATAWLIAR